MAPVKPSQKTLKRRAHFFWEGKLHKTLKSNKPANLIEAWCYSDRRVVVLLWSDLMRSAQPALLTEEVCAMLGIHRNTINNMIAEGAIRDVERQYPLNGVSIENVPAKYRRYMWSEHNVLDLHDALLERHKGRPRKDKKITPLQKLPTRAQIKAMFRNEQVIYVRTQDGRMVPVFEQPEW